MKEHLKEYLDKSKTKSVRGLRILLEYFYATEVFEKITDTGVKIVSVFGSARTKRDVPAYKNAHKLGQALYDKGFAVVTGGSYGIMQAANEGVAHGIITQLKKKPALRKKSEEEIKKTDEYHKLLHRFSAGLKITLPREPENNPFVGVFATFHYFMVRKFFFGTLSSAFIACEGGWGTRDELFEILTLVQTGKAPVLPIIYISERPEHLLQDLKFTLDEGYIDSRDLDLIQVVKDYKKAVSIIDNFYHRVDRINYAKDDLIEINLKTDLPAKQKSSIEKFVNVTHKNDFSSVAFRNNRILLHGFRGRSYGVIRKLIDIVNS